MRLLNESIRLNFNQQISNQTFDSLRSQMNDQALIEIQKHNNKVNRILNKLCERNPALTEQIDLALYSCLKIQKIIKKYQQQNNFKPNTQKNFLKDNADQNVYLNEEDQLYQNALNIIQGFKGATKRLQNKVGVLLRQQEISRHVQRARYHDQIEAYYEAPRQELSSKNRTVKGKKKYTPNYENTSPFSPHIVSFSQSKQKGNHEISSDSKKKALRDRQGKRAQAINESQSFEQVGEGNESRNIQELDQQIIELASQIKHIIERS